jgi:hypothetical protein
MPSLADLYEQYSKDCLEAADRTEGYRVILRKMAQEWLRDAAALRASTQSTSLSTDAAAPSRDRAA